MGRVGALSRPEPPVVCQNAPWAGAAPRSPQVYRQVRQALLFTPPRSQLWVRELCRVVPILPPPHTHTHTAALPPRPSERKYKAAETTLPPFSKWPGKVS